MLIFFFFNTKWAENHPLVGRLKINDFMMIPVQRLTRYQLLLEKIFEFTDDEVKKANIAIIVNNENSSSFFFSTNQLSLFL
jgi:hypothetical protein